METVTVNADALRQLLQALNGPSHHIRELQVTRGMLMGDDNPINILCDEYNAAADVFNATVEAGTAPLAPTATTTWNLMSEAPPADGQQCWISFCFPDGTEGQAYGIWQDDDWFFDVTTDE